MYNKEWTVKEIEVVRAVYPSGGSIGVSRLLPHRTRSAINYAAKSNGIRCKGKPGAGNPVAYLNVR